MDGQEGESEKNKAGKIKCGLTLSLLVEIFCAYTHCTACCFDSESAFTGMYEPADSNSLWERKSIRVRGKKLFALAEKKNDSS